jgi:hypothetical protein
MHAPGRPNRSIGPSLFIGFQALPTRVPRPVVQHVAAAVSCVVAALIHRHPCTGARPSSTLRPHIGCRHGVLHRRIVPSVVLVHHVVQSGEDEDAMLSAGREEGGPGFHRDVVAVLVPPLHPTPLEASPTDDAAVTTCPMPPSTTILLRGLDRWEGRRCRMRSPMGCICAMLSTPMDPLHRRDPRQPCRSTPTPTPNGEHGDQRRSIARGTSISLGS